MLLLCVGFLVPGGVSAFSRSQERPLSSSRRRPPASVRLFGSRNSRNDLVKRPYSGLELAKRPWADVAKSLLEGADTRVLRVDGCDLLEAASGEETVLDEDDDVDGYARWLNDDAYDDSVLFDLAIAEASSEGCSLTSAIAETDGRLRLSSGTVGSSGLAPGVIVRWVGEGDLDDAFRALGTVPRATWALDDGTTWCYFASLDLVNRDDTVADTEDYEELLQLNEASGEWRSVRDGAEDDEQPELKPKLVSKKRFANNAERKAFLATQKEQQEQQKK